MKKLAVAFALVLAAFALTACGSSSDDSSQAETQSQSGGAPAGHNKPPQSPSRLGRTPKAHQL
jgi:hypothetical protein